MKHANELLTSGRFELARMLLRAFGECRLGQTGTMTWVDSASVDLVEARRQLDHEGVKNYYRTALGYPLAGEPVAFLFYRRGAARHADGI